MAFTIFKNMLVSLSSSEFSLSSIVPGLVRVIIGAINVEKYCSRWRAMASQETIFFYIDGTYDDPDKTRHD